MLRWEKGAAAPLSPTLSPRSYNQNPTPRSILFWWENGPNVGEHLNLWKPENVLAAIEYVVHEQGKPMAVWWERG